MPQYNACVFTKDIKERNKLLHILCSKQYMKNGHHPIIVSDTKKRKHIGRLALVLAFFISTSAGVYAQDNTDSVATMTLDECIDYAMQHQPALNVSRIGLSITKTTNAIALSGWLPQVVGSATAIHYFTLPTSLVSDSLGIVGPPRPEHTGVNNTVIPEISASQVIFNPQLLYAANTAKLYVRQATQVTDSQKIIVVAAVSKAFYNLLLTLKQIDVLKEDTARLDRNVMDTYHQFVGGIVDETDYDEAVITLNTSKSQLVQEIETIRPQYDTLKQLMGYPPENQFNVLFDTSQMLQEISFDTTEQLDYQKRIEYQQLMTDKQIAHQLTNYYALSFIPSVSAMYNYFYEFENPTTSGLFANSYPYSYIGLSLNIPIFTGFARLENIHKARLQEDILKWQGVSLKSSIYTQYSAALAAYKSTLYNWHLLEDNLTRAKNVYRIVTLQYKQGIIPYLNVIVAESNLITAEVGYTNALFQLLDTKVDLERAMGDISYNR